MAPIDWWISFFILGLVVFIGSGAVTLGWIDIAPKGLVSFGLPIGFALTWGSGFMIQSLARKQRSKGDER